MLGVLILCLSVCVSGDLNMDRVRDENSINKQHNPLEKFQGHKLRHIKDEKIKLIVDKRELKRSGEWVEVSWNGVTKPTELDLIALYAPHDADPKVTAPVKYQLCTDPSHVANGSGKMRYAALIGIFVHGLVHLLGLLLGRNTSQFKNKNMRILEKLCWCAKGSACSTCEKR